MNKKQKRQAAKAEKVANKAMGTEKVNAKPVETATAKVAKPKPEAKHGMPSLPPIPRAKRTRKPRPTHPCACGCGNPTHNVWAPGHDAYAKAWANRVKTEVCKIGEVPDVVRDCVRKLVKDGKVSNITLAKGNKGKAKPEPVAEPVMESTPEPVVEQAQSAPAAVNE